MASASHKRLVLSLFRGLHRVAAKLDRMVPPGVPAATLVSTLELPAGLPPAQSGAPLRLTRVLRHQFAAARGYAASAPDTAALVEVGFRALRQANKRAAQLAAEPCALQALANGRPAALHFAVGHVVQHAQFGYRGVIVGWHESCQASDEWRARNGVPPERASQPFYLCAVDVRDRPEAQVSYVAQDNLLLLSDAAPLESAEQAAAGAPAARLPPTLVHPVRAPGGAAAALPDPAARLVVHPLTVRYFAEYRPTTGAYVPNEELANLYPHDVPAFARAAVARAAGDAVVSVAQGGEAAGAVQRLHAGAPPTGDDEPEPLPSPRSRGGARERAAH